MSELIPKEDILNIKNHFIITKQRSGSTLLGLILSCGSKVKVINEENIYFKYREKYKDKIFCTEQILTEFISDFLKFPTHEIGFRNRLPKENDLFALLLPYLDYNLAFKDFCNLFYHFLLYDGKHKKLTTIINKDIIYHIPIGLMHSYLPEAKFIFLVRDSPSNIYCFIKRGLGNNIVEQSVAWNYMMKDIIKGQKKLPKENKLIVKYEELISKNEETIKKICQFLNIPYEESMLDSEPYGRKLFNYTYNRAVEENGIGPLPLENDIHLNSRRKIDINKINDFHFTEKDLKKIYLLTNKRRQELGYEKIPSKWKSNFLLNPFDFYFLIRLKIKYTVHKAYFRSDYYSKVLIRKINIFNFLNNHRKSRFWKRQ